MQPINALLRFYCSEKSLLRHLFVSDLLLLLRVRIDLNSVVIETSKKLFVINVRLTYLIESSYVQLTITAIVSVDTFI